jgi:hypothetical protein
VIASGKYQATIAKPLSPSAVAQFVAACRGRDFTVAEVTVFDLLDLGHEWKMESLQSAAASFIESNHLARNRDYLGEFLSRLRDGTHGYADINAVASRIDGYFGDSRLRDVHPEELFKIVLLAQRRGMRRELLLPFVLSLFESDAEKAVPLCLLVDFEKMTDAQRNDVFQCRELHRIATGYFVAAAISWARNKAQLDVDSAVARMQKRIKAVASSTRKRRAEMVETAKSETSTVLAELRAIVNGQRAQIEELKALKVERQRMIDDSQREFDEQIGALRKELERQRTLAHQRREAVEKKRRTQQEGIDRQVEEVRHGVSEKLKGTIEASDRRRESLAVTNREWREAAGEEVAHADIELDKLAQMTADVQKGLKEWRAVFAAKLLRDDLRADHFLRQTDQKFEEFAKRTRWELSGSQLAEADKVVAKLETRAVQASR